MNKKASILVSLSLMLLTGCWGRQEIENIGLVVGVGIDIKEEELEEHKRPSLIFTNQFVVPGVIAGEKTGGGSADKKPFDNLTLEESTLFEGVVETSNMTSRSPSYAHLKVIMIGEEAARSVNMLQLLSFFFRDHDVRRTIHMIIANGKAKDMLEIEPTKDQIPALKFLALSENVGKTTLRGAQPLTVGDLSEKLSAESSFLMQYLVAEDEEIRLTGAAVISGKDKKMVGLLNKEEVTGLNWLLGEGIGGVIEGTDKKTGESILYEIADIKSKIEPKVKKGAISFNVTVKSEGRLSEDWVLYSDAFKEEFLKKAEKAIENEVKHLIKKGLEKTQKEFYVDVTGFSEQIRIQYPKEWEKVKENWDERFSEVPINIKVKINIRQFQTQGRKIEKKE